MIWNIIIIIIVVGSFIPCMSIVLKFFISHCLCLIGTKYLLSLLLDQLLMTLNQLLPNAMVSFSKFQNAVHSLITLNRKVFAQLG